MTSQQMLGTVQNLQNKTVLIYNSEILKNIFKFFIQRFYDGIMWSPISLSWLDVAITPIAEASGKDIFC